MTTWKIFERETPAKFITTPHLDLQEVQALRDQLRQAGAFVDPCFVENVLESETAFANEALNRNAIEWED